MKNTALLGWIMAWSGIVLAGATPKFRFSNAVTNQLTPIYGYMFLGGILMVCVGWKRRKSRG